MHFLAAKILLCSCKFYIFYQSFQINQRILKLNNLFASSPISSKPKCNEDIGWSHNFGIIFQEIISNVLCANLMATLCMVERTNLDTGPSLTLYVKICCRKQPTKDFLVAMERCWQMVQWQGFEYNCNLHSFNMRSRDL